jgi:hypothetical protein
LVAASLVVIGGSVAWWSNRNRESDAAVVANRDSVESLGHPGSSKTDEQGAASRLAESRASNSSPDSEAKLSGTSIDGSMVGSVRGIAVDYDHDHVPIPHATLLVAPWSGYDWGAFTGLVARVRALSMQSDADRHGVLLLTADAKGEFETPELDRNEKWSVVGIDGATRVGEPFDVPSGDTARSEPMKVFIGDTTEILGSVATESGEALPDARVRMISALPGRSVGGGEEEIPVDDGGHFRLGLISTLSFEATAAGAWRRIRSSFHFGKTQHLEMVDLVRSRTVVHGQFVNGDGAPARDSETPCRDCRRTNGADVPSAS